MTRQATIFAFLVTLFTASSAIAEDWARKMFKVTTHDFGTVARGATSEFAFEFTNLYEEDVHVATVRSSCGCTTPTITKQTVKTFEKSSIVATYNTKSFLGQKNAALTVVFDKPFYAEVQLTVNGFIRGDVVFSPGVVDFGSVNQGDSVQRKVTISYAGRPDWRIVDVRSAFQHVLVDLENPVRSGNRVSYEMSLQLKPDTPSGLFQAELAVVSDDAQQKSIPLQIQGNVISALTVSPAALSLGVMKPGQKVTKQLLVRGKLPFKIVGVKCDDCIEVAVPSEAKKLHFLPVTFTAGTEEGSVSHTIEIETDLGAGTSADCVAKATVKSK